MSRLVPVKEPAAPEGVVIVLHGGASRGPQVPVNPNQLSVLRMVPIARAVARAGRGKLAVYRQLNTYRGWDATGSPLDDTRTSLDVVRERYPDVPVGLVGHSLGGRTALVAGASEGVESVAVLNPWLYPDDPRGSKTLAGRRVLFVHGDRDRIASPAVSRDVAKRIARDTLVGYITVPGAQHAMLKHGRSFDRYAAEFTAAVLLGDPGLGSGPVAQVLAGEGWVTA